MGETPILDDRHAGDPSSKKPLKRGFATAGCRNFRTYDFGPQARRAPGTPHNKAGRGLYSRPTAQVNPTPQNKKARTCAGLLFTWYRGGDSNPYSLWPLPPQGSVSTNSTTSAKRVLLLLWNLRHICRIGRRLWFFEHRYIFDNRFLLHFHHRWIWQADLSQLIRLLFSKVT